MRCSCHLQSDLNAAALRIGGIAVQQRDTKKRRLLTRYTGRQHGAKQNNGQKYRKNLFGNMYLLHL